jgi:hypothetical protein
VRDRFRASRVCEVQDNPAVTDMAIRIASLQLNDGAMADIRKASRRDDTVKKVQKVLDDAEALPEMTEAQAATAKLQQLEARLCAAGIDPASVLSDEASEPDLSELARRLAAADANSLVTKQAQILEFPAPTEATQQQSAPPSEPQAPEPSSPGPAGNAATNPDGGMRYEVAIAGAAWGVVGARSNIAA